MGKNHIALSRDVKDLNKCTDTQILRIILLILPNLSKRKEANRQV